MDDKNLYFNTSEAENLGIYVEPDSSVGTPSDVKKDYVFKDAVSREPLVGTMPINEDISKELAIPEVYIIPKGYHSGSGKVYTSELSVYTPGTAVAGEIANNKVAWVNGERIVGTLDMSKVTQEGTATATDVAEGKTAWVNGEKVTGTVPVLSRQDKTLLAGESYTFPYGISAGNTVISAATLAIQTQGTATAARIFKDDIAWVNGEKVTGTYDLAEYIKEFLKETDALQSQVLSGMKFYSAKYDTVVPGTMADHTGEAERVLTNGQTFAIPEGYYNGESVIRVSSLADVTIGTAEADDIKYGLTAWANGIKLTGTAPNIDPTETTINAGVSYTIPQGYHSGSGKVTGASLSSQTQGTAAAEDIKLNKVAWVNGVQVTGEMPVYEHISKEITCGETYVVPHGYHDGGGWVYCKDLASQTVADATAEEIIVNKTAWVNGTKITGTMPNIGTVEETIAAGETYAIPKGYHDGNGLIHSTGIAPQTEGTATVSDILKEKTAWVNGVKLTGTLELTGSALVEDVLKDCTFYSTDAKTKYVGTLELTGDAVANEVMKGYTFYSTDAKTKLTGTLELLGNAQANHVLAGEVFYTDDPRTPKNGTMVKHDPEATVIDSGATYYIPQGFHTGAGYVRAKGIGEQTTGTATAGDLLKDKTAWVNGVKITGTLELTGDATPDCVLTGSSFYASDAKMKMYGSIPIQEQESVTLAAGTSITIPAGYYPTSFTITAEDLSSQTIGTAEAGDIVEDATAWVNGVEITGSIPDGDDLKY